jgi:aldehyde:ferredoxin oxidoreductase
MKNMTKVINTQIHKNKILQERIEKLNIKDNSLYKIAKLLRKRKTPVGNIVANNIPAIIDKQKADTLARFYSDVHNLQLDNRQQNKKKLIKSRNLYTKRLTKTQNNTTETS